MTKITVTYHPMIDRESHPIKVGPEIPHLTHRHRKNGDRVFAGMNRHLQSDIKGEVYNVARVVTVETSDDRTLSSETVKWYFKHPQQYRQGQYVVTDLYVTAVNPEIDSIVIVESE